MGKFKLHFIGQNRHDGAHLLFFGDPKDRACLISIWYGRTGKMSALYRHGKSITKSVTPEQRRKINDMLIVLLVRSKLEGFFQVNGVQDKDIWAELPL